MINKFKKLTKGTHLHNALNINEFEQQTVRGALDLSISRGGVISGQISPNQATALNPGDFVELDASATGSVPQFIAAPVADTGFGAIARNVKQSVYNAGDPVEVAFAFSVIYVKAAGTIAMGAALEDAGSGTVQTKSAQALKGYALESAVINGIFRMMLTPPVVS